MKTEINENCESVVPFLAMQTTEIAAKISDVEVPQIVIDATSESGDNISKKEVVIHDEKCTASEESLHQRKLLKPKATNGSR